MNDFDGLLTADFGFKPQGKSAPMKPSSAAAATTSSAASFDFDLGSRSYRAFPNDSDSIFSSKPAPKSQTLDDFSDLFAANARSSGISEGRGGGGDSSFNLDSMFNSSSKASSSPVYDKPVYDDDIFEGVPGMKTSGGVKYDDVFASMSASSPPGKESGSSAFDDLLGGFGRKESESKSKTFPKDDASVPAFDDLLPGFGGSSPPRKDRTPSEPSWSSEPTHKTSKMTDDPFASLGSASSRVASPSGLSTDPLEEFSKLGKSESMRADAPSVSSGVYNDMDPFDGFGKPIPPFSSERSDSGKDRSPFTREHSTSESRDNHPEDTFPVDNDLKSSESFFGVHSASSGAYQSASQSASDPSYEQFNANDASSPIDMSPRYQETISSSDEAWLTVSEIPLFTRPTSAPPPSRPPPPRPARVSKAESSSFGSANVRKKVNEVSSFPSSTPHSEDPRSVPPAYKSSVTSIDDLEDFAMGRSRSNLNDQSNGFYSDEMGMNSDAAASAAAMKEAMDRAEAKFRHAKEVRERENTKTVRSRDTVQLDREEDFLDTHEKVLREKQEKLERERLEREKEEEERDRRRLEKEREKEERERRLEKERERAREIERERARQVVERAAREARERAAAEARERAAAEARQKAQRAAVEKVNAEARERAERAAVLRAQAEARERAAAEARERAERAAAEAREREARERAERAGAESRERESRERAVEARMKAERAAVERAAAEARERAATEARERAATRANQQKNENDLESFFNMGRSSSAPRPTATSSNSQSQSRKGPDSAKTSESTSSSMRKASSTTNIVDDLSSIFGGVSSSGEFQDVEGESEERRRARLERHQRAQERAAKALAEKNQRDLQVQREQAERHRISETLDVEIKRWAAGKEGNLRALLSTLQYVLWPECGWQPVSLTDLITAAAVKKVYRKATLCIHPDKVQQKGANIQQKYIAEKVFDLLKEAWNKFNSEELF